jgi:hypothetical protein
MRKSWRDQYKVHPAADVFPMMSDDALAKLGEDIAVNGLREAIKFLGDELVVAAGDAATFPQKPRREAGRG